MLSNNHRNLHSRDTLYTKISKKNCVDSIHFYVISLENLIKDRNIFMKFFIQRLVIWIDSIKTRTSITSIEVDHLANFFVFEKMIQTCFSIECMIFKNFIEYINS